MLRWINVVFVIVAWISSSSHAASFYGSSYVSLPLQEARSTTELSFRFRTSRPDALLLLAAGRTDYCLVVLQSATLKVRINLGAGEAEVATPTGLRLDDLAWHEVRIQRKDADFSLTVDGLHISKLKLPGRFYELNIHYGLFVGGLGDFREIFLGLWDNFRGCLNDLIYNGVDVLAKSRDASKSDQLTGTNNGSTTQQQQQQQVSIGDGTNSGAIWIGATWDCSAEFDATSQQDVSFLAPDSYVAFAGGSGSGIAKTGSTLRFQLKTTSREAILLYSSGPPAKPDFAAVELVEGHLRVSTDSGSGGTGGGAVDIFSEQAVHDGHWHQVELHLAAGAVEMTIDNRKVSSSNNQLSAGSSSSGKRYLELSGQIYLGGIDPTRHLRALNQGVRTANTSLRGCVRQLELDGRSLGLREARVTRKVAADCQWHYACASNPTPCIQGAQCHQEGLDDFRCECPQTACIRPDYVQQNRYTTTTSSSNSIATSNGIDDAQLASILTLTPVQVTEGGSMTLTSRHLQLLIDYEKFGVRESGVLFHVIRPPQNGRLSSALWRRADEAATFTLLDVHSDRVRYVHDGSETVRDSALLELELATRGGFLLPANLQKRHRFLLQFAISAVNDPPELSLPAGKAVLRLVKHTRKVLSSDLLTATDPDSSPRELIYSVLNSKSDGDMEGSVENKQQPGVAINSFTQEDVNQGRIWYVHRGSPNGRLALRVSDGAESGPTAVLRIAAFDLQLFLANNTGLVVPVNGSAALTGANLTFSTNAPDQELDIRYDITRPPLRGQIQAWRGGRWQSVGWFTSGQLQRGERLRYVHLPPPLSSQQLQQQLLPASAVQQDDFQFSVSVALEVAEVFRSPTLYQFRLQLQDSVIRAENNRPLNSSGVGGNQHSIIDASSLRFVTEPHATSDDEIVYTLIDPPVYGSLWVQQQPEPLGVGSKFTQKTVSNQRLEYKLTRRTLSDLHDRFTFRVSADSLITDPQSFDIYFTSDRYDVALLTVSVKIGQLLVNEGETAVLQPNQLSISVPLVVNYTVTESPIYGMLNLLDLSRRAVLRKNVRWFGSDELADQRIVYTHDDSESPMDRVRFVARPQLPEGNNNNNQLMNFQYVGDLPIVVRMKNDNPPVRAVDRVLRVVTNGERKLNSDILKYVDPDIETDPANIIFTRRGVPNGAFYFTDRPDVQVFQFSQADVNQGKVLFRHQGSAYGRTALWVTDGSYHATGSLEVQASNPFLERVNHTFLTVQRTRSAVLGVEHLGLISNMDYSDNQLVFHLVDEPQSGTITLAGSDEQVIESFSQSDLVLGKVSYSHWNNRSENGKDRFSVRAVLGKIDYEGIVDVRIYSESYWQPLKVLQNQLVTVEEGTSFTIDPSALRIGYATGVNPQDVTYMVHQPPTHGYLEVDRDEHEDDEPVTGSSVNNRINLLPPEVHVFDQSAINEHRLHYIQSGANQSSDHFVFDVTNGVVTLTNLTFQLAIIPKSIYLLTRPVEVLEGGQAVLTVADLKIVTRYYADKVDAFVVNRPPTHGSLHLKGSVDSESSEPLGRFTYAQLIDKQVVYWHDGGEDPVDSMDIVAFAGKKESLPATVQIKVRPVDDERPVLVNNTGILVWQGSTTLLDNNQLGATDVDTLPHSIEFSFEKFDCGYLASGPNLSEPVSVITQRQIELRQVVFVHQNGRTNNCSVAFNLTDGQSSQSISQHRLQISARKMQMRLVRNQRLHVFPLMQQSITSVQLLAVTNGGDSILNQQQNLPRFQVVRPPRLGRLLLEGPDGSTRRVTHFTQRDLNQSLVIYEHTEPFADLSVSDSFAFDVVSDLSSPLQQQQFDIEISVATMAEGGLDRYLGLVALETEEGGTAVIREKNLNLTGIVQLISAATTGYNYQPVAPGSEPRLKLILSQTPQHGFISVAGRQLTSGGEVQVGEIAVGRFVYQHDHSDTLVDFIGLTVLLQPGRGSEERRPDILLYNGTLRVNILPVNDQIFHLLTKAPAMTVVERQWKAITSEVLMTEDADTAAKDLIYEIIQPPKYGKLAVTQPDNSTVATTGVSTSTFLRFSQDDVNRGRVVYLHDGTMEPRSTSFYFRVSDGHFKADSGVFTLRFEPLTLKLANHSIVNIQQGQSTAVVSNSSMGAESNGQRRHIFYNITREPENGRLYINDVHVNTFGQSNIDKEELLYVQFNMMASSDWFQVTVWNMAVILERQIFNVSVAPLIGQTGVVSKRPGIRAAIGEKTAITTASLDAGRLATLTNSNPTFTILRKPRYGKIRKIVPSSSGLNRIVKRQSGNGNKEKDTNVFSHEDVQSNFIFYVARKTETGNETQLIDSCEYRLTAPNVQPAIGVLEFLLVPSGSTLVAASKNSIDTSQAGGANNANPRNPSPTDIVTENTLAGLGLGIGIDIFLIVGIVCGILALGLVILIIIKCRMKPAVNKQPKNEPGSPSAGEMQLYRLSGTLNKNGHQKAGISDFQVTDAYRISTNMLHHQHPRDFDTDSDPEPPPPPRLDYMDPPLSPRPSRAMRVMAGSPIGGSSTISSLQGNRTRGSWHHHQHLQQQDSNGTPASVPQCKIIPLLSERSESEASELVNARYPYGIADESMEEWAMLEPESDVHCTSTYSSRTTNPMLRKNQYWV